MQYWIIQALNSLALGGLLFLLAAGFSLIFGLMRIANLTHGALYMLGAYVGVSVLRYVPNLWLAALVGGTRNGGLRRAHRAARLARARRQCARAGAGHARHFLHRRGCVPHDLGRRSDPDRRRPRRCRSRSCSAASCSRAIGSLSSAIAVVAAIALYVLMERTRLGAMIRAGVDDMQMARAVGIPVSRLFTTVFCLGAALAGAGGVMGGPIMSAYPGLDADMLPLALIVVMLGGVGSLLGAFVGSFIIGFIYTFGTALLPDLAYMILFLPMIFVIAFRPTGLFGRHAA